MSEQELRECPFCGRHNIGTDYGPYRQWVQCFCHDCGASAASCDSEVLAIAAWNQRAGCASCRDEAIGAALAVEQKCYDQAQELAKLRAELEHSQGLAYMNMVAREDSAAGFMAKQNLAMLRELAPLRKLREAVRAAEESLVSAMLFGPVESGMVSDHQRRLSAALNAYDEASAPTET